MEATIKERVHELYWKRVVICRCIQVDTIN
ncbi:MAG: hypothetical protein K0R23_3634 [Lacrimispora sp.]|jgi:hypothetical protein|nr:hypothetical protein [Lacrimispora sp.]